ncbi:hypothetical protein NC651_031525 [Populus alba x Populus x berolinensis]|nr:hypothetical protein NC651_031525 [Populus alba x Populus x berolinensis]
MERSIKMRNIQRQFEELKADCAELVKTLSIEMTGFGTWSDKAIRASPTSFSQSGTTMESEGRVIEEFIGAASGNNSEQPASANDDQFPDVH